MKKILLTAAVLAVGVAMADDTGIVSAEVVGYQTKSFEAGFNYVANTFLTVGKTGEEMTFSSIEKNGNVSYLGTTIQLLDDGGATAVTSEYEDLGDAYLTFTYATTDDGASKNGWYLMEDWGFEHPQNDRVLPFGQGYCVDCGDDDAAFIFAGVVSKEDVEIELSPSFNYTGNCSPTDITFNDLAVNGVVSYLGTTIQILDDGGATATTSEYEDLGEVYLTFTYATTADGAPTNGWYLMDDWGFEHPQNDRVIAAGAGFCIDCGDDGATITIPAAL